jgi:hypothetical protein
MLFGSTVLEVALGLMFVYLLLSLLCSAVGEYIEAKLNSRAKYLQQGIRLLLNETDGTGIDLAERLYSHGLVRPLYRNAAKLPSYIPSRTFALALWNMATSAAADAQAPAGNVGVTSDLKRIREAVETQIPNQELKTALLTLIDEANGDLARARKNVEDWYDAMMDRVSGWYKRRTAVIMLVLGFVVAAAVNADTISLAKALARDGALRRSIAGAAERHLESAAPPVSSGASTGDIASGNTASGAARDETTGAGKTTSTRHASTPQEHSGAASAQVQAAYARVNELGLPIGWVVHPEDRADPRAFPEGVLPFVLKLFGLLLTGFAISQGAPFWFDLLNRFMVVRSTVKPSEKSREQPSKDRPAPETSRPEGRSNHDGESA